jgi:hypothetical protein
VTRLESPLHEVLFQSWAKAHGIQDHDDPKNIFDYRKIYQDTGGQIHPHGMLNDMAKAANGAVGEAQQGGDQADPYAAQAEMHSANLDSQSKQRSDALKKEMNTENNKVKIHLKTMELQHKSMQAEKDRAHKQQEAQLQHHLTMQQAERDRQAQAQQEQMGHAHAMEQAHVGHQHDVQVAQMGHQNSMQEAKASQAHDMHSKVMQEQLARSRPQPQAQPAQQPTLGSELYKRQLGQ